jgi:hypothetical protein
MVLASGCGSKTLVRIGGGSLKSLVVLLVLGVSAFATLKGITAVLRVTTVDRVVLDISVGTSLAQWAAAALGLQPSLTALLLGLALGGSCIFWAMVGRGFLTPANLLAGIGMGGLVIAMWWVSGHLGHLTEHPETLQETFLATNSGRAEALSFVAPVGYLLDWLLFFSDKSKVLTMGITSTLGVVLGSWCMALATGSFGSECGVSTASTQFTSRRKRSPRSRTRAETRAPGGRRVTKAERFKWPGRPCGWLGYFVFWGAAAAASMARWAWCRSSAP